MPTRSQARATFMIVVFTLMAATWPRLWAARHAAEGDRFETVADAINVAF